MKSNWLGFTLIEMLVVVLIIAILGFIALPQYQKAVEKSRAVEAKALANAVYKAEQMLYLTDGAYATSFDQLEVSIPWANATKWFNWTNSAKGNADWTIHLERGTNANVSIFIGRQRGPYEGAGFFYQVVCTNHATMPLHELLCVEKTGAPHKFQKQAGAYCEKLMHGERVSVPTSADLRIYRIKN